MKTRFKTSWLEFLANFWLAPKAWRERALRQLLNFNNCTNYTFKIADTKEEVLSALTLLKRAENSPNEFAYLSNWKINKFLTLPSSTLIIGSHNGEIVAVAGLLIDNPFGLPSDASAEASALREQGHRLGEILGFTCLKNSELNSEVLYLGLNDYIASFAKKFLKVDYLVALIPSSLTVIYQGVLCYTKSTRHESKKIYSDDGTPLQVHVLSLNSGKALALNAEESAAFAGLQKNYQFPSAKFFVGSFSSTSTQIVQKLFAEKSQLLENLSISDKLTLEKMYTQKTFRNVIPLQATAASRRTHVRYPSACPTAIHTSTELMHGLAIDVSYKGLSLITQNPLIKKYKMAQSIKLTIELAPGRKVELEGEVIWKSSSKSAIGVSLNKTLPQEWLDFIDHLEAEFVLGEYKKVG